MANEKDSLRSRSYVRIVDLISEGEIEGLVDGKRSVYLNETPIENADGSENYAGVTVVEKKGTNSQASINFVGVVENEVSVDTQVKKGSPGPIVRTITDSDITGVRVRIRVPALYEQNSKGEIVGTSARIKIYLQSNGGGYVQKIDNTISGKASNGYDRDFEIALTGEAPWDIKVERVSDDTDEIGKQNSTIWKSYTEIIHSKLRYPNSAIVGIRFNSESFTGTPRRAYDVKLLKVKVPSNYTPTTRAYSGVWDGTFKAAKEWTDNPAWCFYDLLTNTRYGLGGYLPETQIDKWALYQVAQYCDELVPNGEGGYEPRFTCNLYIQSRREAYKVVQDMASIFRGMVYWSSGALTVSQDAPSDPVALYTAANVVEGFFTYSGTASKARHSVALVTWNDPEDFYRQKVEYVEDAAAIARFGLVETEVTAVGCTSRGQANRVGRWLLYSEQNETETVTFRTGLEGCVTRPGHVIKVADPTRAGARLGGRIETATTTQITVDADFTLPSSSTLYAMLADGTVESRTVSSKSGRVLTLASALSAAPQAGAVWMVSAPSVEVQTFRVISMSESGDGQVEITALKHDPEKYASVETGLKLQPRDFTRLNEIADAPKNVVITEALYETSAEVRTRVTIDWDKASNAGSYRVAYKVDDGNFVTLPDTANTTIDIDDAEAGLYTVQIRSLSPLGRLGRLAETQKLVFGKTLPPGDVSGVYINVINQETALISWTLPADLDVRVGGKILIRHTPATVGATWENATSLVPPINGNETSKVVPFLAGTYLLRAMDELGKMSPNASVVVVTAQMQPQPAYTVRVASSPAGVPDITFAEDLTVPPFQGNLDGMLYSVDLDGLILANGTVWDSLTGNIDDFTSIDAVGGVAASGEYEFGSTLDLGAVFEANLRARFTARAYNPGTLWDDNVSVDEIVIIDDVVGNPDAALFFRYGTDGVNYSDWIQFRSNLVRGRYFQFKIVATSGDQRENILIEELGVTVLLQQHVQSDGPLTSGAGTYSVTFPKAFYGVPQVVVTGENMNSGDYATIASITRTGFQVTFKNSGGSSISRQFHYTATGYGKEV